jgi:hypothetical protein
MKYWALSISLLFLLGCAGSINKSHIDSNYTFYVDCDSTQNVHKFQLSRTDSLPFLTGKLWNNKFHDTLIALSHSRDTILVMSWYKGNKSGISKLWYHPSTTNGIHQIKLVANYLDDKIDGEKISYWPNGKLRTKDIYKNGQLISAECWDSESGKRINGFLGNYDCMKQALLDEENDNTFYQYYYNMVFSKSPICKSFK